MKPRDRAFEDLLEAYAEFCGRDVDEIREDFHQRQRLINEEWHAMVAANWQDRAERFYSASKHYILELLASGPTAEHAADKFYDLGLGDYIEADAPLDVLELGAGLGFAAEALARKGHRVTCIDVPGPSRAFAEARLRKAACPVRWITPLEFESDPATYDLVWSDAAMEHLVDPYGVAVRTSAQLRVGGTMHHSIDIVNRGRDWPMHRWVDLGELDAALAEVGLVLKARSGSGVNSRWEKVAAR